jgi:hypothetical protein
MRSTKLECFMLRQSDLLLDVVALAKPIENLQAPSYLCSDNGIGYGKLLLRILAGFELRCGAREQMMVSSMSQRNTINSTS